jgi:hypothetical protein
MTSVTLRAALGRGASDLYYHSVRIVPVNLAWGAGFLLTLWCWATLGSIAAAVLSVALAFPVAGLARLGGLLVRDRDVNLSDALDPLRRRPVAVLATGTGLATAVLVLTANVVNGLGHGGPAGWAMATLAGWGLLGTAMVGVAVWPLLTDPRRDARSASDLARLAGLLVLAQPVRMAALALLVTAALALGTLAFVVLLVVGVGFAMLVACRYVLPAADRLEARLAASG